MNFATVIEAQLAKDVETLKALEAKNGGSCATFCAECHRNTYVGHYPRFHVYRRYLCEPCGTVYTQQLKALNLWPQ